MTYEMNSEQTQALHCTYSFLSHAYLRLNHCLILNSDMKAQDVRTRFTVNGTGGLMHNRCKIVGSNIQVHKMRLITSLCFLSSCGKRVIYE